MNTDEIQGFDDRWLDETPFWSASKISTPKRNARIVDQRKAASSFAHLRGALSHRKPYHSRNPLPAIEETRDSLQRVSIDDSFPESCTLKAVAPKDILTRHFNIQSSGESEEEGKRRLHQFGVPLSDIEILMEETADQYNTYVEMERQLNHFSFLGTMNEHFGVEDSAFRSNRRESILRCVGLPSTDVALLTKNDAEFSME